VVRHYIRSKSFVADVIAVLPLRILCYVFECQDRVVSLLKFNQLVKFYKVNSSHLQKYYCGAYSH